MVSPLLKRVLILGRSSVNSSTPTLLDAKSAIKFVSQPSVKLASNGDSSSPGRRVCQILNTAKHQKIRPKSLQRNVKSIRSPLVSRFLSQPFSHRVKPLNALNGGRNRIIWQRVLNS